MNKKKAVFGILIPCIAVLLVFSFLFILKQYKIRQAVGLYDDFIDGSISVGGWDIIEISTPTGEPDKKYKTDYTMVDVTGDGIPELHIKNGHEYIIFSASKGQMYRYAYFQSYGIEYYPLENGKFLLRIRERYEYGDYYTYFELNTSGEPVNELNFSWISSENYTFDENDEYVFDGSVCTFEEWYDLTREYLYTDTTGTERIRNAAEWISYCTSSVEAENTVVESVSTDLEEDIETSVPTPDKEISESKPDGQDVNTAATYKLLNQDIFGEKAVEEWHLDSVSEEIYEFTDLVKGRFEAVSYEGDLFPSGLIDIMGAELYSLNEKGEISDSWYETLDVLGADVFRLDLDEMYWAFPELYVYRDEIETEYDAYNRIFREQIAKDWVSNEKDVIYFVCEAMFMVNMAPDEDYYVFTYTTGRSNRVRTIDVMKRIDGEFVKVDRFEAQMGGGRIVQYDNNFYYVTLYANDILHCIDGIRIHKLGTNALEENILIRYVPEHYAWKNIYDNEDTELGAELEDYIDNIRPEITSDEYLENGDESGIHIYYGDEVYAPDFVVENEQYGKTDYYQIDFANIGVPVYLRKHSRFPPHFPCFVRAEFYLCDEEWDEVLKLENMGLGVDSSYPFGLDLELQQIWFKEIGGQVLTFCVYYLSDYNYMLDVILVEGDKITRVRSDIFTPDQSRFVLTEGKIFWTM